MKGRIGVHVTVNDLAVLVDGTVHGDGERAIVAAKPVPDAGPRDVTFVENERNLRLLETCRAAAVVAPVCSGCAHLQTNQRGRMRISR